MFGSKELLEDVRDRDLCIGCGACVALCPYFRNYRGKTAMIFECTLEKGRCFAYCPKTEVDLEALSRHVFQGPYDGSPLGVYEKILSCQAGIKMDSGAFQGGGTVSALMVYALKRGIIDAAVLTDRKGVNPMSRVATCAADVLGCSGSKFMASPTLAGFNRAVQDGIKRLGVVGTPCQMTAVSQMRTNPLKKPDFSDPVGLAVGLFCNWALGARELEDLLSRKTAIGNIRSMDIPPPPANVMCIDTGEGSIEIPLDEVKPLIPNSCFICPDMTSEFADLSVGMYEGQPGWNTLIIRTGRGLEIVEAASADGYLETAEMPTDVVEHLKTAAAGKKERAVRMLMRKDLLNRDPGEGRCTVRMPEAAVRKITG